ncbi:hypothetical protein [Mycobacteroides abscessus]|nr:hypothetical protein [Mycobacteroides abscessus]
MTRPNSGVTWLRNPQVRAILQELARSRSIDPSMLDGLPHTRVALHIRALLAEYGLTGARVGYRRRYELWADEKIATVVNPRSQLVLRAYIRWHLAHKLGEGCTEGRFLASKQVVTVAAEFLNWLDAQDISLENLMQPDVDRFLAEGTETRRRLDRFLPWAIKTYKLSALEIAPHRRDTTREKTHDEQVEQLRAAFSEPGLTVQDRLMAALILVFGQPTHKVVALQWTDIRADPGEPMMITLGKHPIALEHPLDDLVNDVRISLVNRQTAANRNSAWVFPGYTAGVHLTAGYARVRLKELGFPSRATRIGTWRSITQTAPPPVLADALGLSAQRAIRHAQLGSAQYGAYISDILTLDLDFGDPSS